jgi:TPR repeat protein
MLKLIFFLSLIFSSSIANSDEFSEVLMNKGFTEHKAGNIEKAIRLFKLAADEGNINAVVELATIYFNRRDYNAALRWLKIGAENNHREALYMLGISYEYGFGVTKNLDTAINWHALSASKGKIDATYRLGKIYQHESKQKFEESIQWFKVASEKGHAEASYELGYMHYDGIGLKQNYKKAFEWYSLASEQGSQDARYNLAIMYYQGEGVVKNIIYAHMWFDILSQSEDKDASDRKDFVAGQMTKEQIAEAQRLARECVAKDYKGC